MKRPDRHLVPDEEPLSEAELSRLNNLAQKATDGPWGWYGSRKYGMHLATKFWGRVYVMRFERLGMSGAQPTFQVYEDETKGLGSGLMTKAKDLAVLEVPYRDDIIDIDNPDAQLIAACDATTIRRLIYEVRRFRDVQEDALERD